MEQEEHGIYNEAGATRPILPTDGMIAIMGREGDVKKIWNPDNSDEVADARRSFDDLRKKGYLAYRVTQKGGVDGEKGEQMVEFDPKAGKIIMTPPLRGG